MRRNDWVCEGCSKSSTNLAVTIYYMFNFLRLRRPCPHFLRPHLHLSYLQLQREAVNNFFRVRPLAEEEEKDRQQGRSCNEKSKACRLASQSFTQNTILPKRVVGQKAHCEGRGGEEGAQEEGRDREGMDRKKESNWYQRKRMSGRV